jgi:hypothetical protein
MVKETKFKGLSGAYVMHKDTFDLWWEWVQKPLDSQLTIDADP